MRLDYKHLMALRFAIDDLVYMRYQGAYFRVKTYASGLPRVRNSNATVEFETGAESLKWLNDIIAVGVGRQSGYQPVYGILQVGN